MGCKVLNKVYERGTFSVKHGYIKEKGVGPQDGDSPYRTLLSISPPPEQKTVTKVVCSAPSVIFNVFSFCLFCFSRKGSSVKEIKGQKESLILGITKSLIMALGITKQGEVTFS